MTSRSRRAKIRKKVGNFYSKVKGKTLNLGTKTRKLKSRILRQPLDLENQRRIDPSNAKKGRHARKKLYRLRKVALYLCLSLGVGLVAYKLLMAENIFFITKQKLEEFRQPLAEATQGVEGEQPKFDRRVQKFLIVIGMLTLICISIATNNNSAGIENNLPELDNSVVDADRSTKIYKEVTRIPRTAGEIAGLIIQCGFWVGNLLSTYSQFWCRCYSKLDRSILFEKICKMRYAELTAESAKYLIPCIFSGRPVEMLYPWFMQELMTYYEPMLGVFRFIG